MQRMALLELQIAQRDWHTTNAIADMKKPTLRFEEQKLRNIQRADIAPSSGYAIVVDGHFKTEFSEESAAKKAARDLLANFPMLRVEIYNAPAKTLTLMKQ